MTILKSCFWTYFFSVILLSCNSQKQNSDLSTTIFRRVNSEISNITFTNPIIENDSLTYFKFPYIYMGGGVAIGDINNDGLSDIFFTGNMVENKLYLNKGEMQFEDITESAGVAGDDRWYSGVTMTDINNDGWIDLYLSVSGKFGDKKNQLLINNGDLTFIEKAADYGIDDASNSIQSTFLDYDEDGDLDLFVANYPLVPISMGNMYYRDKMDQNDWEESGHLYRNTGDRFEDATQEAGILNFGLTLGVVSSDFNNDGLVDMYLSNDFNVPDYLYLNNGDGTFSNVIDESLGHISMFGMGIDASDFNNDGLVDLVQVDMTPEDYVRAKVNMASMSPETFYQGIEMGFHYQYMQNSLQVNRGISAEGIPVMSEISRMSNMSLTDWSWSALFADLDNDGWKDVYVTNGNKRDVNDNDVNLKTAPTSFRQFSKISVSDYESHPIANYAFKNLGGNQFVKFGNTWNLDFQGFSNGMAYGDLDNDGDLDLVINNIDHEAVLYENNTQEQGYLKFSLEGPEENLLGIGARVTVTSGDLVQMQEQTLTRGFQSSMEPVLHFGLGQNNSSSVQVVWSDGKEQLLKDVATNEWITLAYRNATEVSKESKDRSFAFHDVTAQMGVDFQHKEDLFDDYRFEPLLPYKYSMMGPALATGDVNNDGLEDFFVGNASGEVSALYVQNNGATFKVMPGPWEENKEQEDVAAVFVDFDHDGDQDLYVATHGNQFQDLTDRLYLNTSKGFIKAQNALPSSSMASVAVAACDYNKDGLVDLFVGGRNQPGNYPHPASSLLLKNNGGTDESLKFEIEPIEEFNEIGLVTNAEWADLDGDDWPELILAGEWMPITIFKNKEGKLQDATSKFGMSELIGWWYAVKTVDVDNDGDLDLVAGNLGLNHKYQASEKSTFQVYASDFDENGTNDIVFSYNKEGMSLPLRGRECSSQQIPAIAKRFETFRSFAAADMDEIYGSYMLEQALHNEANSFAHHWFENENGRFTKAYQLPIEVQFSSVNAIEPFDYNNDEYPDLFLAGNLYSFEVETPRSDAGLGLVLIGSPDGFKTLSSSETGCFFRSDIKNVSKIQLANGSMGFLLGSNDDELRLLRFDKPIPYESAKTLTINITK